MPLEILIEEFTKEKLVETMQKLMKQKGLGLFAIMTNYVCDGEEPTDDGEIGWVYRRELLLFADPEIADLKRCKYHELFDALIKNKLFKFRD